MSDTSLQTTLPAPAGTGAVTATPPDAPPRQAPRDWKRSRLYKALWSVASLRLTVILFVLSLVLVFFGTLAQIDRGIWAVVTDYFRSFIVWIPFQLVIQFCQVFFAFPKSWHVPGAFPFPGGWTLGAALLVNLLAAHAVRFRINWKRAGILLIHAGLIVMLVGELITGLFAVEGVMQINEGASADYVLHNRYCELAVITPSDE